MPQKSVLSLLLFVLVTGPAFAGVGVANGWRGNGTGLWPDSTAPLEWQRIPKGVVADLRIRADRPPDLGKPVVDAMPLAKGIVRDWLVLGPIAVKDSVQEFVKPELVDDTSVQPSAGDTAMGRQWKKMTAQLDDRFAFGPATAPVADVGAAIGGCMPNHVAYAHTYLYAPRGGTILAVVDHMNGMKAWLNGREVYSASERRVALGSYYPFSRVEFCTDGIGESPRVELKLQPGWNRLLLKIGAFNRADAAVNHQTFNLRLMDVPAVSYESKNIVWMTELPQRSNATPIVVGDRVFVLAEPDELICLDKHTGKILWKVANNYYEMLSSAEREANPAFREKIDPLQTALKQEHDFRKRLELRTQIQRNLVSIDAGRFAWKADGHYEAHFGIVGFATPTPVSDGKHVWVWCGNAVAACYDLDGQRRWMTRVDAGELSYTSAPALADGTFAVYLHYLTGLDAETGKVRWKQKKVNVNNGAVLAARIAGVDVFVSSVGDVIRAVDGKLLYREPDRVGGSSTWSPPVILGNVVYLPRYGVKQFLVLDFTAATGDDWQPQRTSIAVPDGTGRLPNGKMVDRPTCGSPLVVGDLAYLVDIYATLYVYDLKAKKLLYLYDTELEGLFHYNAVPVAASPTLIGKHIVIQDNQGTALVLEPGRTFRQVRKNQIGTQLERWWPVPAQETIGYSPPVPDGGRLYIRGERYLYCIGAQ
jgi:outer membrane protein assembly factor BamB